MLCDRALLLVLFLDVMHTVIILYITTATTTNIHLRLMRLALYYCGGGGIDDGGEPLAVRRRLNDDCLQYVIPSPPELLIVKKCLSRCRRVSSVYSIEYDALVPTVMDLAD